MSRSTANLKVDAQNLSNAFRTVVLVEYPKVDPGLLGGTTLNASYFLLNGNDPNVAGLLQALGVPPTNRTVSVNTDRLIDPNGNFTPLVQNVYNSLHPEMGRQKGLLQGSGTPLSGGGLGQGGLGSRGGEQVAPPTKSAALTAKPYTNPALKKALDEYEAAYHPGGNLRAGLILDDASKQAIIDKYGAIAKAELADEQIKRLREQTDLLKKDNEFIRNHPELKDDTKLSVFTKTPEWADVHARQEAISNFRDSVEGTLSQRTNVENIKYTGMPTAVTGGNPFADGKHYGKDDRLGKLLDHYSEALAKKGQHLTQEDRNDIYDKVMNDKNGPSAEISRLERGIALLEDPEIAHNGMHRAQLNALNNHLFNLAKGNTKVGKGGQDFSLAFDKMVELENQGKGNTKAYTDISEAVHRDSRYAMVNYNVNHDAPPIALTVTTQVADPAKMVQVEASSEEKNKSAAPAQTGGTSTASRPAGSFGEFLANAPDDVAKTIAASIPSR